MWKLVENNGGLSITEVVTVGDLKEKLKNIPDDYSLSVTGITCGLVMNTERKQLLMDEISFLEALLSE